MADACWSHPPPLGIGDALQLTFRLLGHRVISDNHIGDWGTQFGKLLLGWKKSLDREALERDAIAELERLYKIINTECDANPARLEEAKAELVKLQAGDAGEYFHLEGNDPAFTSPVRCNLFAARREV